MLSPGLKKYLIIGVMGGVLLELIFGYFRFDTTLSKKSEFSSIALGQSASSAAESLSRNGVWCELTDRTGHLCYFSDPWRNYVINVDPKSGVVVSKRISYKEMSPFVTNPWK